MYNMFNVHWIGKAYNAIRTQQRAYFLTTNKLKL